MGLFNKRNLAKAKALAEKNKEKIASGVNKATDTIDKKTGGKHTDKLKKIDDAAKKFAGEEQHTGTRTSTATSAPDTTAPGTTSPGTTSSGTTSSGTTSPVGDSDTTTN